MVIRRWSDVLLLLLLFVRQSKLYIMEQLTLEDFILWNCPFCFSDIVWILMVESIEIGLLSKESIKFLMIMYIVTSLWK